VGPVRKSSKRPTFGDCLRELGRLIQQDHGPTCVAAAQKLQAVEKDAADASTKRSHDEGAASLNANQVLMLHNRMKIIDSLVSRMQKEAETNAKIVDLFKDALDDHTAPFFCHQ
jgi:hypothetical protein